MRLLYDYFNNLAGDYIPGVLFICHGRSQNVNLLADEMREIGAGEAEGDCGFTTTEERKVNNVKVLIRESQ